MKGRKKERKKEIRKEARICIKKRKTEFKKNVQRLCRKEILLVFIDKP